ncbi:hypothetical protein [Leptospira biflexa]|uniref:hypothetical protein n=1 Tax=Leptospira biflexa TaxID=172 RepID=UPI0010845BEB|nr:hypothetical protein [Leptospira biflexa]TGM30729.1 hypothetical protein EHQ89_18110 [Leptospira biflexa]TGM34773.1 hypothetical protein EHQ80_14090 [Leptospira biflexa]
MKKSPAECYKETEKEIPIWKQRLSKIENEIANAEFYTHKYLEMSYNESIKLEKLKKRKEEILLEAQEKSLWEN